MSGGVSDSNATQNGDSNVLICAVSHITTAKQLYLAFKSFKLAITLLYAYSGHLLFSLNTLILPFSLSILSPPLNTPVHSLSFAIYLTTSSPLSGSPWHWIGRVMPAPGCLSGPAGRQSQICYNIGYGETLLTSTPETQRETTSKMCTTAANRTSTIFKPPGQCLFSLLVSWHSLCNGNFTEELQ